MNYRWIYFLIKDGKVIYIGQTKNINSRLITQKNLGFTSHREIKCDADKANYYEYRWIQIFKPKCNSLRYHPHNWRKSKNSGCKPIFKPEALRKGQKLDLGNKSIFGHQYARAFNKRFPEKKFKFIDGQIQRVA